MNLLAWPDHFFQDIRFGARSLRKRPAFTVIAAGSLALGIGASTAMFSVIYGVILDPFPYKDVGRLMSIRVSEPGKRGGRTGYTVDQYLELAGRSTIFEGVIASTVDDVVWTGNGDPQRLRGNHCSMNTFDVMGVPPLLGRTMTGSDAAQGAEPVTVLGYKFWQRQFGGDTGVIGRKLHLNGKVRTVIGIMPPRFMWRGADVYVPLPFHRGVIDEGVRDVHVLGRLKKGVTAAQAEADLRPIIEELQRRDPKEFPEKWRVSLLPFTETFPSDIREALWILFGAVGLLLLIACVNVSNLLLSQAAARQREIAVRASLGASRWRLIRQLLAETLALTAAGGLAGVLLAYAGLRAILLAVPPNTIPDEAEVAVKIPALLFAIAISVLCSVIAGLAPAIHLSGKDIATPLKEAGRGGTGGRRQNRMRMVLVAGEIALSLMLLVGSALMLRTLIALQSIDLGIRADRLLTLRIPFSAQRYPDASRRVAFMEEVLRRVGSAPGVEAAAVNTGLHPFGDWRMPVEVEGNAQQDARRVMVHQISAGYIRALGLGMANGRLFSEAEVANRAHVAIVNRLFVTRYLGGRDALGRVVRLPRLQGPPASLANASFEVMGVVNDAMNDIFNNEIQPEIYIPYTLAGMADEVIALSRTQPRAIVNTVRTEVYAVDRDQPLTDVKTVEALLQEHFYSRPRFNVFLFSLFAAIGLTLAVCGVYGVISNAVAQRTQEIGLRMALGASFTQVMGMVLGGGMRLLLAGIAVGLAGSLLSVRVLASQIGRMSVFDASSFAAVPALLFGVGLFACFWPARRAAKVDPLTALRHE